MRRRSRKFPPTKGDTAISFVTEVTGTVGAIVFLFQRLDLRVQPMGSHMKSCLIPCPALECKVHKGGLSLMPAGSICELPKEQLVARCLI